MPISPVSIETKVAKEASGFFKQDAVTGVNVKEEIKKVTEATAEELNNAIKAKYLPHTINNSSKESEELGKAYALAHGNVYNKF